MLSARNITKRFGHTLALASVDFTARFGEIHAILGQNGAGKTTLMSIIAGRLAPDAGEIVLDRRPIRPGSPHDALRAGIAAVHQTPLLFDQLTWEENLAIGGFGGRRLDLDAAAASAAALAARLGFRLPPRNGRVEHCSLGERVRLEILLALGFDPRVLVLDEPTGMLAPSEVSAFLDLLRGLRAENRAVILVTHRLAEARAVADRITVLRDGRIVSTVTPKEIDDAGLAVMMIGDLPQRPVRSDNPCADATRAPLKITGLRLEQDGRAILNDINLTVRPGEVVAVAGVEGNGQAELVEIIAGLRIPTAGSVSAFDVTVVPQDRDRDGFVLELTLWENLMLDPAWRARLSRLGWVKRASAIAQCRGLMENYSIRAASTSSTVAALSGGNRQRMLMARAIANCRRMLVAHDVWRGLDVAGTVAVSRMIAEYAASGGAALLIGGDLDELLAIGNRLLLINSGRIHETAPHERTADQIGLLMAGRAG